MSSSTTSALSSACSCAIAHFADLFRASAALLNIYILWILSNSASGIKLDNYNEAD
ncbi:MAG: hypothetical protein ACYC5W_18655 [Thauera sp.]|jgi:hypothetical protein